MHGPADTLRVALADVPWPLPHRPVTRDEVQLARTLESFHVQRARPGEIVARRGTLKIVFRQVQPHRAAVLFRRGELDEAPVPLGDIRAALADAMVKSAVHMKRLRAVDALQSLALSESLRHVLSATADRRDYALLVPEDLHAATPSPPARVSRAARRRIPELSRAPVRIAVKGDATVRYGASLLVASWRDLGLDVRLTQQGANAIFTRDAATAAIPIAHAVDARFVSPRVRGWREDADGVVDYTRVTVAS